MFPGGLFNNPWHSWRSTNQLEDTQTIPKYDLFDDDMTSTSNPCNRSGGTTTPTQSQLDTLPRATSAQPSAPAPVAPSDPESEYNLNVWRLHAPSHHNTPEPEHFSSPNGCMRRRRSSKNFEREYGSRDGLQSLVKERERELSVLHEAFSIQSGQERTAQQYEKQLNELRKQFESSMQSHIDKLQTTRMAGIETRVQDEVTRLSSMLQAGLRPAYPQPTTPNLDAIKRIRRSRGVSKRTWLIGVDIDDNPADPADPAGFTSERHEAETGEKAVPGSQDDQPTSPPVSAMVEVITKSVETTLRTLLESGGDFSVGTILQSPRRTPRHKKQENHKLQLEKAMEPNYHCDFILAKVHCLFKEKLGIVQDIDFITHAPASAADVHAYKYEDGPSPDTDKIVFDLAWNYSSPWNTFLLSFLLREFQLRCTSEAWPIRKEDDYVKEILWEHYKRLRTLWRNAQPKLTTKGVPETPAEHEARLKYHRRKTVLDRIVAMKSETSDDDLGSWKWLQRLINTLGEHSMSSEESSVENGIENVLRVKKLEWRRNIDKELEIVDLQRVLDKDIFCSQGSKPLPRKRAPDNPISSRVPVVGLPMALYDDTWILQLTERWRESLEISKAPFPWMKLVAT
ncbi:hypothetical protein EV401DRAFT_1894735 [Pisolithus croceorrhizus]|nr:hypothetical protein EV401DRAFT_1894735 [Pisolithus croceorrhizus]